MLKKVAIHPFNVQNTNCLGLIYKRECRPAACVTGVVEL